jgi:hypothetical protein
MENAKSTRTFPRTRRHAPWAPMLLLTLAMALPACQRTPAETRLRHRVEAMRHAVAERDARGFMQGVAADFQGNDGIDRDALHNLLRAQILANTDIGAIVGPLDVQVDGRTARVRFDAMLTGATGGFVPDRAQAYRIDSGWREENGQWRAHYARWEAKR